LDYDDVISSVDEAIKRGLIDPERIVVAGWSQGGFISYICTARNGSHRRLALLRFDTGCWCFGSRDDVKYVNTWLFQAELAGGAPWEHWKKNIEGRKGSAVWEISKTFQDCPPCLLLHRAGRGGAAYPSVGMEHCVSEVWNPLRNVRVFKRTARRQRAGASVGHVETTQKVC